ncbi:MAG: translation initiation factor IF-2, partial [Clostridia bacterium]|nr:translation initiation factor IF-2 [Clostridia bacterium]
MLVKYKVNELAKDFAQDTKALIEVLKEKFPERAFKNTTTLEEVELNYVFDYLTQKHSVKSFDEYFALGEKAQEKRKAEKDEKKQARLKEQELLAAQLKAAMAAQKEGKDPEAAAKAVKDKAEETKKAPAKKPVAKKVEKKETEVAEEVKKSVAKKAEAKVEEKAAEPKRQDKKKAPAKPRTEGRIRDKGDNKNIEIHTVESYKIDTRASDFDADKYNEKYDEISPAHKYGDNFQKKQKIKQKSKQYNKAKGKKQETEADRLRKLQLEKIKAKPIEITVGDEITVGELASRMKKTAAEVVKQLMMLGIMAGASETIDYDTAAIVATEMGAKVEKEVVVTIEERIMDIQEDKEEDLKPRDPVVVVMGHVDHGKTSILDRIRSASVTSTEAGGITQHIGAYQVTVEGGNNITFLDTPGHAAFTAMRQRGANVTDIAILVVAADDGIMPQTIEAINHAKAAGVEIIVAINKMDKPGVTTDNIMQQLTEHELVPEEWGGNVIVVPVSAHTGMNIDKLLENVLLVAEMQELKANPDRMAKGAVIEAKLDKGRGPVATILVQNGTLKVGDIIVAGKTVGRVRVMLNDKGERVKVAGPSVPVEITGLDEVPSAGDTFDCVSDERLARELVEQRKTQFKEEEFNKYQKVTLDNLFDQLQQGDMKDLNIIVKADVQGSVEAVKQSLEKLSTEEVRVRTIHGGVGAINESDISLAATSSAIVVGFNVRPNAGAAASAESQGVDMRL